MLPTSSTCPPFPDFFWSGLLPYTLVFVILFFPTWTLAQNSARNFTLHIDSPQIIYTPFLCGRDNALTDCNGGWQRTQENEHTTILTTGPDPATQEIIPQMFFEFQGSALYLFTSPTSSAQANITITTNGTTISATFDSTLGLASILNLAPSSVTTFSLTFLPENAPHEFSLTSMIITVPNGAYPTILDCLPIWDIDMYNKSWNVPTTFIITSSSTIHDDPNSLATTLPILPSMTLPPSSSPPIFTPPSTPSTTPPPPSSSPNTQPQPVSSAKHSNIAIAVGVTVGLGLGLSGLAGIGFWWYKRRRPNKRWVRSLTTNGIGASRGGSRSDSRRTGGILLGDGRSRSVTPGWGYSPA